MLALSLAILAIVFSASTMISLLIALIIGCVILAVIAYIVNQMAPPQPIRWAIWGIVLVVVLILAIHFYGAG
jgi:hypothetical protein